MFNRARFENSRPDGIPVLEVVESKQGQAPRRFVPLRRSEMTGEITGPLAALTLTQYFGYSRGECDAVLEAVYRFPLPGDAAVTGVTVRFGEVEIRAELKEREAAEQEYAEARAEGRQAALTTRESPDVFTLQVTGLQPDEEVRVETRYVQLARPEGAGWALRIPLTTSPRYVRGDERGSRHAEGQPLALLRDPGHRFSLDLCLRGSARAWSSTHALASTPEEGQVLVQLREGEVLPDRDCVLCWLPEQEANRPTLTVFTERDAEHTYFLALLAPPHGTVEGGPSREVILLVDHSGSMEGAKWEASDWAVSSFLSGLEPRDAFTVGLFHHNTWWLCQTAWEATEKNVQRAIEFVLQHRDSGGTDLGVALEQALEIAPAAGERARNVLIITDAEVTDGGRILRLADEEAKRAYRRRISVLCVDAAPNSHLAHELAERGGGVARFLTSSPEEEDITTALEAVLADWEAPVRTGLSLEVNRPGVESPGHITTSVPAGSSVDLGDLPEGRTLWITGRVPQGEQEELTVRVTSRQGAVAEAVLDAHGAATPGIKPLFGARRVLALEYLSSSYYEGDALWEQLERLGYDPAELSRPHPGARPKLYAENQRKAVAESLRALLAKEALTYGLASSETAFIATRTEAGQPVAGTVEVANALPSGWSDRFAAVACAAPAGGAMSYGSGGARYARLQSAPAPPPAPSAPPSGPLDIPPFLRKGRKRALDTFTDAARLDVSEAALPGAILWSAPPVLGNGQATLFDSSRPEDAGKVPDRVALSHLTVRFPGGTPQLDPALAIQIYLEDLAVPRATVRLADLLRQGGRRPLNLLRRDGAALRIVLTDPNGDWAASAPAIELEVQWQ